MGYLARIGCIAVLVMSACSAEEPNISSTSSLATGVSGNRFDGLTLIASFNWFTQADCRFAFLNLNAADSSSALNGGPPVRNNAVNVSYFLQTDCASPRVFNGFGTATLGTRLVFNDPSIHVSVPVTDFNTGAPNTIVLDLAWNNFGTIHDVQLHQTDTFSDDQIRPFTLKQVIHLLGKGQSADVTGTAVLGSENIDLVNGMPSSFGTVSLEHDGFIQISR